MTATEDRLKGVLANVMQPVPKEPVWKWADQHFRIPQMVGSPNPGEFDSNQMPFWRPIFDLMQHPRTRHIAIRKGARVGGSLLAVIAVCHKISTKPGPILWVDPSRKTAMRLSRNEIEHFLLECRPVKKLAVINRQDWTALERTFEGCTFGIVGAGSAADLAGRQAEMLVLNETDKLVHDIKAEAPPHELAIVRTKQFMHTRKIIENSTPTTEWGRANQQFLKGTQCYIYVPCPLCGHKQRLTFFEEEKEVPFDEEGKPLPTGQKRLEKTGCFDFVHCRIRDEEGAPFDLEKVERETTYRCAKCAGKIPQHKLPWMNRRAELRAHNPDAPADMPSVHVWGAHSPFESWGGMAKKFLMSKGNIGRMHDFYNSDLGLPFVRHATEIKDKDLDIVIRRSPDYVIGQLPREPLLMTMHVDVQQTHFWWTIRAWGILEDHPDQPTWNALIDYGAAVSFEHLQELAGIIERGGQRNTYKHGEKEFVVDIGIIDSGYRAKGETGVYQFCRDNNDVFIPAKGGGWTLLRGARARLSTLEGENIELLTYDDEIAKQQLYYQNIKDERILWWLPRNVGEDYRAQMTAERTREKQAADGTTKLEWVVEGEAGNHLADTEKLCEVLRELVESSAAFEGRRAELEKQGEDA
jgi:phage terminase large subunit GpA-like protein